MSGSVSTGISSRIEFLNQSQLPAVIEAEENESLLELLSQSPDDLSAVLRRCGAILFRGFNLSTAEEFHSVAAPFLGNTLSAYVGGISPRGEIVKGVYESTRYPAHLRIPQHNEMSYLPEPPRRMAFFCEVAPQHGGETPLSDSRVVHQLLPSEVRSKFEEKGIRYHRNLYGPRRNPVTSVLSRIARLHTSWMSAFATDDPAEVERICAEQGATVTWNREQSALISNVLPAVRNHPETGEPLWFNQVSTFVVTRQSAGAARWLLYYGAFPRWQGRPFHASYGDGEPIAVRDLNQVHRAIDAATVQFRWRRGDLLLVDNYLVMHGRMPYRGARRILVAMH